MTMTDEDKKLFTALEHREFDHEAGQWRYRNPDAPAALARIRELIAERDEARVELITEQGHVAWLSAEVERLRGVLTLCRNTFVGFRDDDTAVRVVDGMHLPGPRAFAASVAIARIDAALATEDRT